MNEVAERIENALVGRALPEGTSARTLFADHPDAYAVAIVDRDGTVLDTINPALIPPWSTAVFVDDWITQLERPTSSLVVAGHEFTDRDDGLRIVFVMASDPAHLVRRAYLDELYEHVLLPIGPLAVLLIALGVAAIRRGLTPVTEAADWARGLRPGASPPPLPPSAARLPAEIADLVAATRQSLERLAGALVVEKRQAAEAAHALRTPVAVLMARVDALPAGEAAERMRTVAQVLAAGRADGLQATDPEPLDLRGPPLLMPMGRNCRSTCPTYPSMPVRPPRRSTLR
ncbi:MAG: hypothetical protein AAF366_04005 [Pseudomonadota bacterium]